MNTYINELSAMVPSCSSPHSSRKLDKSTILKLTVSYMKLHAGEEFNEMISCLVIVGTKFYRLILFSFLPRFEILYIFIPEILNFLANILAPWTHIINYPNYICS